MANDLTTPKGFLQANDSEYVRLVSLISGLWDKAKENAALAVNTELLEASWATGRYKIRRDGSSDHFWVWHIIKDGRCMMEDGRWKIL